MLKESILRKGVLGEDVVGYYCFSGYDSELSSPIYINKNMKEVIIRNFIQNLLKVIIILFV